MCCFCEKGYLRPTLFSFLNRFTERCHKIVKLLKDILRCTYIFLIRNKLCVKFIRFNKNINMAPEEQKQAKYGEKMSVLFSLL